MNIDTLSLKNEAILIKSSLHSVLSIGVRGILRLGLLLSEGQNTWIPKQVGIRRTTGVACVGKCSSGPDGKTWKERTRWEQLNAAELSTSPGNESFVFKLWMAEK